MFIKISKDLGEVRRNIREPSSLLSTLFIAIINERI